MNTNRTMRQTREHDSEAHADASWKTTVQLPQTVRRGRALVLTRGARFAREMARLPAALLFAPVVCLGATTVTTTVSHDYEPSSGLLMKTMVEPGDSDLCLVTEFEIDAFGRVKAVKARNCNGSAPMVAGAVSEAAAPTGLAVFAPRPSSSTTYTADQRFIQTLSNALNHVDTHAYDPRFGWRTNLTDANQITVSVVYDGLGRKSVETGADGTKTKWTYGFCQNPDAAAFPAWPSVPAGWSAVPCQAVTLSNSESASQTVYPVYYVQATPLKSDGVSQNGPYVRTYLDTLDRPVRVETQGFDASGSSPLVYTDTSYNRLGRVAVASNPYYADGSGGTTGVINYSYDSLSRIKSVSEPYAAGGAATTVYAYSGQTSSVTDPRGYTTTQVKNLVGLQASLTDSKGTLTRDYDPLGNEVRVTDAKQNVISYVFDRRGRRLDAYDPDMGHWSYGYNAASELVRQTDAKNQLTQMSYDLLGRLTQRAETDLVSTWTYDKYLGEASSSGSACGRGLGKLCQLSTDHGYDSKFVYDSVGRAVSETLGVDQTLYAGSSTYDAASGRKTQTTYPSGLSVTYAYTGLGYAWKVLDARNGAEVWRGTARNALGKWLQSVHGNGVVTTNAFYPDGNLNTTQSGPGNGMQSLMYAYDKNRNVATRLDLATGVSATYGYDELNRLTSETRSGGALSSSQTISWTFDAIGNMTSRIEDGKTNTYNYNTSGVGSLRPHAAANVSGSVNGVALPVYAYDGNGNMASGAGRTVGWSASNMVQSITKDGKQLTFYYGPERERVKEVYALNGATQRTTIYMNPKGGGGLFYEEDTGVAGLAKRNYVSVDGSTVAVIVCRTVPCTTLANTSTQYWHEDRLGTVTLVTDAAGAVAERMAYEPFGKRRNVDGTTDVSGTLQPLSTHRGFTKHEHIDEIGLINMNGRVFDPALGRFMSADPTIPHPDQTQSYNRYSYVRNNPLGMTDPSGFSDEDAACDGWCTTILPSGLGFASANMAGDILGYGSGAAGDSSAAGKDGTADSKASTDPKDGKGWRELADRSDRERQERAKKAAEQAKADAIRRIDRAWERAVANGDVAGMEAAFKAYLSVAGIDPSHAWHVAVWANVLIRASNDAGVKLDNGTVAAMATAAFLVGMSGSPNGGKPGVPGRGYHIETKAPTAPVKPSEVTKRWETFLGPGPYTNTHPRTGAADKDRIVSADGTRSIRYGDHEMSSSKPHYHEERWTYDPAKNVMNVDNTIVRIGK